MRIDRLRKIAAQIRATPENFDIMVFHSHCGTAHCIAGWAEVFWGGEVLRKLDTAHIAMAVLGLTEDQAGRLFWHRRVDFGVGLGGVPGNPQVVEGWPDEFREPFNAARSESRDVAAAEIAAQYIEAFIEAETQRLSAPVSQGELVVA